VLAKRQKHKKDEKYSWCMSLNEQSSILIKDESGKSLEERNLAEKWSFGVIFYSLIVVY
jgi:hypothetical protein